MNVFHDIQEVRFIGDSLEVTVDGAAKRFRLKDVSPLLEKANEIERETFAVSPSGYGIHWPLLDEDIFHQWAVGNCQCPNEKKKNRIVNKVGLCLNGNPGMLEMQEFRGNYQNKAGRIHSPWPLSRVRSAHHQATSWFGKGA